MANKPDAGAVDKAASLSAEAAVNAKAAEAAASKAAKAGKGGIRVRATAVGVYGVRRYVGEEFTIRDESQFSTRWMARIGAEVTKPSDADKE